MKTRNKSLLSSKVNTSNNKLKSKLKDSNNLIKRKETNKDVSYRDQHNIGRRKSTSSVVTYSLDSRLFFDVYAKFNNENFPKDRNIYNGICNNSSPSKTSNVKKISNSKTSTTTKPLTNLASKRHLNSENESEKDFDNDESDISSKRKIIKVSYEAKPLNSDESCIPSPKIPSDLQNSSDKLSKTCHSNRKSQVTPPPSEIINKKPIKSEIIPMKMSTKNETFQKLLENKTVFKKHLSKNLLDKVLVKSNRQIKKKTSLSQDVRRLSRRLNKSLNDVDELNNDNVTLADKTKKLKLSETHNTTNDLKLDLSPPKRGKRIASLNAAAIINCVQNLFNESPKHSPTRQNRRRKSKSDSCNNESTQTKENESKNCNKTNSRINSNEIPLNSTIVDKEINDSNGINRKSSSSATKLNEKKEFTKSEKKSLNNNFHDNSLVKKEKSSKIKENFKECNKKSNRSNENIKNAKDLDEDNKKLKKSDEVDKKQKKSDEDDKKLQKSYEITKKQKKSNEVNKKQKKSKEDDKKPKKSDEVDKKTKNSIEENSKLIKPEKSIIIINNNSIEDLKEKSNCSTEENTQANKTDTKSKQISTVSSTIIVDEKSIKKFDEQIKPMEKDKPIKYYADSIKSDELERKLDSSSPQNNKNPKKININNNNKNSNLSRFFDITKRSHSNKRHDAMTSIPTTLAKKPKTFTVERIVRRKPKSVDQCFDELSKSSSANKKSKKQPIDEKQANGNNDNDEDDNGESFWEWVGEPFKKSIQLQLAGEIVEKTCYNAIRHTRDDIIIRSVDCVMLRSSADQEPFLAKIIVFYLDEETGKKMMTLFWYYRPEHTEQGLLDWHTESDVYASRHLDSNSVDCIEDKAFVLPVEIYSRFVAYQKRQGAGTRPGLAARLIPVNNDDVVVSELDENKLDSYTDMFISSWYYTLNFQNSFPSEMTNSNVFVCRGLYDINQHKITRNILQNIQSPKLEPIDPCDSADSAMSISSCESEHKQQEVNTSVVLIKEIEATPLLDIPIPPCKTEEMAINCLPPISSFHNRLPFLQIDTAVPVAKSCPPPPSSKPTQPPLPNSINGDVKDCPKQPNGHP